MAQIMAQPWKHPKTGVYWYRRVVPLKLRTIIGQTEFRETLGTKSASEAKLKYLDVAAKYEARLAQPGSGSVSLTPRQISAFAGVWYRRELAKRHDNPGDEVGWEVWEDQLRDAGREDRISEVVRPLVDELLRAEGLSIDAKSRAKLDEAVWGNALQLCDTLGNRARGDYSPDQFLNTLPSWEEARAGAPKVNGEALPAAKVIDQWSAEKKPTRKTVDLWTRIMRGLTEHLGYDDVKRVTTRELIEWKNAMVSDPSVEPGTASSSARRSSTTRTKTISCQ